MEVNRQISASKAGRGLVRTFRLGAVGEPRREAMDEEMELLEKRIPNADSEEQ